MDSFLDYPTPVNIMILKNILAATKFFRSAVSKAVSEDESLFPL